MFKKGEGLHGKDERSTIQDRVRRSKDLLSEGVLRKGRKRPDTPGLRRR